MQPREPALPGSAPPRSAPSSPTMPRAKRDCGDFEIRIDRNGGWHYRNSPIARKELVCLFASVLKREPDGGYWLETPVERGRIEVEDAPFVAVEMWWRDCVCGVEAGGKPRQCLTFRTNLDEIVTANADHPIRRPGHSAASMGSTFPSWMSGSVLTGPSAAARAAGPTHPARPG